MAAVAEQPQAKVQKAAYDPKEKVLMFSVYPGIALSVEKQQRDERVDNNGTARTIKRGRQRYVQFEGHFAMVEMRDMFDKTIDVDDGMGGKDKVTLQVGIRNMEGYHRDFFECVRTHGMDPKVPTLSEMFEKHPNQAQSLLTQANSRNLYASGGVQGLSTISVMNKCNKFQAAWERSHQE